MVSERRQQWLLGALAVVLLFVLYRAWPHTAAAPSASSNEGRAANPAAARGAQRPIAAPDVHLDALNAERTAPAPTTRNLFRFKPKAPAPPPASTNPAGRAPGGPAVPAGPPPPPTLPPIPLKFIGIVDLPGQGKVAVLRDPAGHVDYGGEGTIIEGRYRVVRIGVESIELAYLDGRGRQTIRLTGS